MRGEKGGHGGRGEDEARGDQLSDRQHQGKEALGHQQGSTTKLINFIWVIVLLQIHMCSNLGTFTTKCKALKLRRTKSASSHTFT